MPKGRPVAVVAMTTEQREHLESWSRRPKTAQALALRSRIVLLAADGRSSTAIAHQLATSAHTVGKWRQRFLEAGLDGLLDEPRPGTPRKLSDRQVELVLTRTLESQPEAATHWSTRDMAKACGLSQSSISRIWRAFSLAPQRAETFKLSRDPLFIEKVRDIVGLYLAPPDRALVLCVDEKSQIQALDRTAPLVAHAPRPDRTPHPRLQAPRHHQPVRRTRYPVRQDHRPDPATTPLRGVPQLPRYHREERAHGLRRALDPG